MAKSAESASNLADSLSIRPVSVEHVRRLGNFGQNSTDLDRCWPNFAFGPDSANLRPRLAQIRPIFRVCERPSFRNADCAPQRGGRKDGRSRRHVSMPMSHAIQASQRNTAEMDAGDLGNLDLRGARAAERASGGPPAMPVLDGLPAGLIHLAHIEPWEDQLKKATTEPHTTFSTVPNASAPTPSAFKVLCCRRPCRCRCWQGESESCRTIALHIFCGVIRAEAPKLPKPCPTIVQKLLRLPDPANAGRFGPNVGQV